MSTNRRDFLRGGALATAGLLAGRRLAEAQEPRPSERGHGEHAHDEHAHDEHAYEGHAPEPGSRGAPPSLPYRPVEMPDLPRMPWRWVDGAKEFRLTCGVVKRRFLPWREPFNLWGYNGVSPGPLIEAVEGDRVRFVVENRLPEETAIHWHGLEVPPAVDGVPGLTQDPIGPGQRFVYEFSLHQNGTFFYHSHMPMQEMLGMIGMFVIHPRKPHVPRVDRDFGIILQEWAILPNNQTPNTLAMEFNWLTLNGRSGPATTPMLARKGERVRIRFVNLGMDHHPMHLHGNTFWVTGTEAGRIPRSAWIPGNTVLVGVAQARDVEFDARYAGDWMIHCHLPHHMMNHMASMVGPLSDPGPGTGTGRSMERGMGRPHGGHALSPENGPSLGRALGAGDAETAAANGPALAPGEETPGEGGPAGHGGHAGHGRGPMQHNPVPSNARAVPGYPQDMWMVMDQEVAKPETYGLRPTWSAAMMGMMTTIRVLEPELFDHIQALKQRERPEPESGETHQHVHGGGR
jgi:FtsP/CotA-like multicopper oxidase with cupredoxin domain